MCGNSLEYCYHSKASWKTKPEPNIPIRRNNGLLALSLSGSKACLILCQQTLIYVKLGF